MAVQVGTSGDQVRITQEEPADPDVVWCDPSWDDIVYWSGARWRVVEFPSEGGAYLRRLRSAVGG